MNWLYVLEANLYIALFYGLYRLFLHRETFYTLNRYYLIGSTTLAFILPLLQVSILGNLNRANTNLVEVNFTSVPITTQSDMHSDYVAILLVYGYLSITIVLLLLLFFNLLKLAKLYFKAKKEREGSVLFAILDHQSAPFSFFNLLFIQPNIAEKETIIRHEMVHIQQKHSFDILFFELFKALNWINPLSWMVLNDIKLIHEYIADEATLNPDLTKHDYAMFLITNSFGAIQSQIGNQFFNPPILKKRIQMLNKEKSPEGTKFRLLLVLPLITSMICASSLAFTKDYAAIDLYPQKSRSDHQEPIKKGKKEAEKPNPLDTKKEFYVLQAYDPKTKTVTILEKRLMVINGKVVEKTKVNMIEGIDYIDQLKGPAAKAKYGQAGVNGALEFHGKNIKTYSVPPPPVEPQMPPPPPAAPPVPPAPPAPPVPSKKQKKVAEIPTPHTDESKLIVVNGKIVTIPKDKIVKFSAKDSIVTYGKGNPQALKSYGSAGKNGIIELYNGKITTIENNKTDHTKPANTR